MKNQLKTIAYAYLLFIVTACAPKDPAPTPSSELAGTYNVNTFIVNNRTVAVNKGTMTIAESGERIKISDLTVNGTSYGVLAELNVVETNGSILIGEGYGVYKDRIIDLRFGVVSGGVENTYILKGSKL